MNESGNTYPNNIVQRGPTKGKLTYQRLLHNIHKKQHINLYTKCLHELLVVVKEEEEEEELFFNMDLEDRGISHDWE